MTSWDISPDSIAKTTATAETHHDTLARALRSIRTHPTGDHQLGATEIAEFIRGRADPLEWMTNRITDVITATDEAVTAYQNGDLQMAAEQQRFASTIGAPTPYRENTQDPLGPRKPL